MTTAKKDVFIFLLRWIEFSWEGTKIWWGGSEWANFWLVGDSLIPPVGKTLYKLYQQVFIYNEKAPCTSHTSCTTMAILLLQDLRTLCFTDIYGIYCVVSVCNTINLSHMNMFNHAQLSKNYLSKEYLSLNIIKHTCSWRNKFAVYIYIYIYIIYIYRSKPSKNQT